MSTTYYLGAGSSAKAIPCVADLSGYIYQIITFVKQHGKEDKTIQLRSSSNANPIHLGVNMNPFESVVHNFCKELDNHLSIDTYAKILYAQNHEDKYLTLKAILYSAFLVWKKQKGFDNRYHNFWATIMNVTKPTSANQNTASKFGQGINIISWNYDTQLEDSLMDILTGRKQDPSYYTSDGAINDVYANTSIPYVKLNGSAYFDKRYIFSDGGNSVPFEKIPNQWLAHLASSIILNPEKFRANIENIKFCWESQISDTLEKLGTFKESISETETLVVIGYSFPSINHGIDSKLIELMTRLKKVYFQGADKDDSERIMDYFSAVLRTFRDVKLLPIDAKGFFIPPEATLEMEKPDYSFDVIFP